MTGLYLGWLLLIGIIVFVWALLFIRMVRRLSRQTARAEEAGTPEPQAGLRALGGFFSDPSVMTERRQLLWATIVLILALLGAPLVPGQG